MRPKIQSSNQSDLSQTPNLAPAKNAAWDALHVSPIGGVLAGIFYLAGILGALLMDGKVSDGWIGVLPSRLPNNGKKPSSCGWESSAACAVRACSGSSR
jgi:hypothetical protein